MRDGYATPNRTLGRSVLIFLLFQLFLMSHSNALTASEAPKVAVIGIDEFYYPNANFAFTFQRTVALLTECGIPSAALRVAELSDPGVLDPEKYPVLLNIYGDAYPEPAAGNIRRYHREGGCIVSNGVPFGFACRRDRKKGWIS